MDKFLDEELAYLNSIGVSEGGLAALTERVQQLEDHLAAMQEERRRQNRRVWDASGVSGSVNRLFEQLRSTKENWVVRSCFEVPRDVAGWFCVFHSVLLSAAFFRNAAETRKEGPYALRPITQSMARSHNQHIIALIIHAGLCFQIDQAVSSVSRAAGLSDKDFSRHGARGLSGEPGSDLDLSAFEVLLGPFPFPEVFGHSFGFENNGALTKRLYTAPQNVPENVDTLLGGLLTGATSYSNGLQPLRFKEGRRTSAYSVRGKHPIWLESFFNIPLYDACFRHVQNTIAYAGTRDVIGLMDGGHYPFPHRKELAGFESKVNDFVAKALARSTQERRASDSNAQGKQGKREWSIYLPLVQTDLSFPRF